MPRDLRRFSCSSPLFFCQGSGFEHLNLAGSGQTQGPKKFIFFNLFAVKGFFVCQNLVCTFVFFFSKAKTYFKREITCGAQHFT